MGNRLPTRPAYNNGMAKILLAPLGSHGDVHPLIGLGLGLQARGHAVTLMAAATFRPLAERHGFEFDEVGTDAEYQAQIRHPDIWHPTRSLRVVLDPVLARKYLPLLFEHIQRRYEPGNTVVVAGSLCLAARLAHEALGVPLVTTHLQPLALQSAADVPRFPQSSLARWAPTWMAHLAYWWADRFILDPLLGPPLNEYRVKLGLKPIRRIWGKWRHSPQCVLGLFPDWFANAPDWPAQTRLTGFIRYDQADQPLPAEVEAFLNAGEPPVVFSFGSAMRHGRPYFDAAAQACERGKFRGLFLVKGREQVPERLPPGAAQFDYAPFSQVFARSRAVVHHGGIGTTAQALAAGVPQIIMPMAFDQPDNADRLRRLGVARVLPPVQFTPAKIAAAVASLEALRPACAGFAKKLAADDALAAACNAVEGLLR